jgi:hypothetical protein
MKHFADRYIYEDGSLVEGSPNYSLHALTQLAEPLERHGAQAEIASKLVAAARYFVRTSDPGWRSPRIGNGGADIRRHIAAVNQVSPDPEFLYALTDGKQGHPPSGTSQIFPWSGHAVIRSGWDNKALWLFFDGGPRGLGHHHYAQLSIQLAANGDYLLVDPGVYSYAPSGEAARIENYLQSTAAHNTALVDGKGQEHGLGFPSTSASAAKYGWIDDETRTSISGIYDFGYGEGDRNLVRHKRTVSYLKGSQEVLVEDFFLGAGTRRIDVHWHTHPSAVAFTGQDYAEVRVGNTRLRLLFNSDAEVSLSIHKGEKDPYLGWYADTFGAVQPAAVIKASAQRLLPFRLLTRLQVERLQ